MIPLLLVLAGCNLNPEPTLTRGSNPESVCDVATESLDNDADGLVDFVWVWEYTYDAQGNKLTANARETNGSRRAYTYDVRGNDLTDVFYKPEGSIWWVHTYTYTYDARGNVLTKTETDSSVTTVSVYTYDARGNVLREERTLTGERGWTEKREFWSDSYTSSYTYTYDAQGNLLEKETHGWGTLSYTYDDKGNVLTSTYKGSLGTEITTYTYICRMKPLMQESV